MKRFSLYSFCVRTLVFVVLLGIGANLHASPATLQEQLADFPSTAPAGWLAAVYAGRHFQPLWNREADQRVFMEHLARSPAQGLPDASKLVAAIQAADADQRELLLTDALLLYAKHLRHGVTQARSADRRWLIEKEEDSIPDLVLNAWNTTNLASFFAALPPPFAGYDALREQLLQYRLIKAMGGWPAFSASSTRTLQPGDRHAEVQQLRQRLEVTDAASWSDDPDFFDEDLAEAVKAFQRRHGLDADGVVGARTRAALAVPVEQRIEQLLVAMERLRWLPRSMNQRAVIVNVPAFRLWLYDEGEVRLDMRTIVGSVRHQTPSFSRDMEYLVLNPNWYVPHSIAAKELVPQISEDPDLIRRGGYEVYEKDSNQVVDPAAIDWQAVRDADGLAYRFVQKPGNVNALGSIKFMFPNPYGIYLHDTNAPQLFARERRAYSHGCVRIEKSMELAAAVLGNQTASDVIATIASGVKNRYLYLDNPMPVYLVYLTAWARPGTAIFLDDLYSRDQGVIKALRANGVTP